MHKSLALLWKYYIPLLLLVVALLVLAQDPDQPILKSIPIVPGPYQYGIAAGFAVLALLLALIIRGYEKRNSSGPH